MEGFHEVVPPGGARLDVDRLDVFTRPQRWISLAMNSELLSEPMDSGAPCRAITRVSRLINLEPGVAQ
jgi:hypothetical protein